MSQSEAVLAAADRTHDPLYAEVVRLAAEQVGADVRGITLQTHFQSDLGYDSLDQVEYTMALEERFDVLLADAEAETIQTVGAALEKVRELLVAKKPAGSR